MDKKITVDFSVRTVFTVVFAFLLIWLIFVLRDILVLFFVAFVLSTALEPTIDFLQRRHIPRVLGIILLYSVITFGLYVLVRLIIPPIAGEIKHLVENRNQIMDGINALINRAPDQVKGALNEYTASLPDRVSRYTISTEALSGVMGIFSGIFGFVTILVVSFYLLLEKNTMENFIGDYWPSKSRVRAVEIFRDMVAKVSLWAKGQAILSGSIGILTYIGLSILGVPYAITLSLIAAVTELLPVIGPYLGAIPAIIIAYTVSPIACLWVIILYLIIQQVENHVLVPQVMKKAVGLSPVAIILAILIGANLLGVLGIILAVPVASALAVLVQSLRQKEA